ncbi:hypothetical protein [Sphingomonas sp. Leaf10]|uniref:hypothetical protein n=1 Tax=Sphingomonas sp. Leaf10 TaxID=1735676 RepID=UPI0006F60FD2|nr:hypothetical protein [Sphingomonas sp. Leaf10]KQM41025.1 hypothetical protein ASE59_01560 [Sphingomonas sp. Leaf10]
MPIRARHKGAIGLVALALTGCNDRREPAPGVTPTPQPTQTAPATSTVPDRITVTTNEPFYAAKVAADAVLLTGVDLPERRLNIAARTIAADRRSWTARDDRGTVLVTAIRSACEDDMSGAPRDFIGTLTFGDRTVRGCAFTGTPAPPPAETAATIPALFTGTWNTDAAACARPAASIEGVKVTPTEILFHESAGRVTRVEPLGPGRIRITADYDGEGERWTATQTLKLAGNRLTIDTGGPSISRVRCPE